MVKLLIGLLFLAAGLFAAYLDARDGTPSTLGLAECGGLLFIAGIVIDPKITKEILRQAKNAVTDFFRAQDAKHAARRGSGD